MDRLIIGCGYLGLRVARSWREQGGRVFAATRSPTRAVEFRSAGLEPIVCDVLDPASLRQLPRVDTVLYAVGWDRTSGAAMRAVYVDGLANVLAHLPTPGKFLHVSSSSVYGQAEGEWVDETSPTEPREESGRIVLEAEKLLREKHPEAVILRFAGIYGPGRLLREKSIRAGEPIVADGSRWLNLIHVEDGVRAILAAEEKAAPGSIYNVCDGQPVRRAEFFGALARLVGAPSPTFVPPPAGTAIPHESAQRRIGNGKLVAELGVVIRLGDFRAGLQQSLEVA